MQLLSNGNALVGWGSQPYFSEYGKSGKRLLDALWPGKDLSYRVLTTDTWVGTPYFPPRGAARKSGGRTTVYVSWDGATRVKSLGRAGGVQREAPGGSRDQAETGFETAIRLPKGTYRSFQVRALDATGKVVGRTKTFGLPQARPKPPSLPQAY